MPEFTPTHGISYPLPGDTLKSTTFEAKLASDIKATALSVETAITAEGLRVEGAATTYVDESLEPVIAVTESGPLYYRGTLPEGTDLNTLTSRSDNGVWTLASSNDYGNLPSSPGVPGKLTIDGTGTGDTTHKIVWRAGGGTYERDQSSGSGFRDWRRIDRADDALYLRMGVAEEVTLANPVRVRGTLPGDVDLLSMTSQTWNGIWTVGSANTNPNLPSTPGFPGRLIVENSLSDRYMRLDWRNLTGSYEIRGQGTTFFGWDKIDRPYVYRGTLPDGTDLNSMTSTSWNGLWILGSTQNYPNRPIAPGPRQVGMLESLSSGTGSMKQDVGYRFNGGDFTRKQTGTSTFLDWFDPYAGSAGPGGDLTEIENRLALLEEMFPAPQTPFENTNIFSTYAAGEAYMDWIARNYPTKVEILDLGESTRGLPIRAFQLGDPTKPTYYVIAAQHGSEPMGRETAYLWVRELCQDNSAELATFLTNACIVITPVVNADRINVSRLSATGTDLNANWQTETTAEITAASSVFDSHNVVLTLDAHEGGKWLTMQAETPTAPEVHQALKDASNALYTAVETDFSNAGEAFERFPGATTLTQARNIIPHRYKSATILFEGTSSLDANMYQPDVVGRRDVYMIVYRSVFAYVLDHMPDFVAAKTAAGG